MTVYQFNDNNTTEFICDTKEEVLKIIQAAEDSGLFYKITNQKLEEGGCVRKTVFVQKEVEDIQKTEETSERILQYRTGTAVAVTCIVFILGCVLAQIIY